MSLHRPIAWLMLITLTAPALGQAQLKPESSAAQDTLDVIPLKYTGAAELALVLKETLNRANVRIVPEERSNSLVVSAPVEMLGEVRALVARLDVRPKPPEEPKGRHLSVLPVGSIRPQGDESLLEVVRLALGQNGTFAIDPARKAVVVYADETGAKSVAEVLARLEAGAARPAQDVQVRVVCLVQGDPDNNAMPPNDVKEVLPALARMGLDQPRLAAQTLVHASANRPFEALGVARVSGNSRQFDVSGVYSVQADAPSLAVKIGIWSAPQNNVIYQNRIETTIAAPPGNFVILGMTPSETTTAAFIVQVLPREDKPARR